MKKEKTAASKPLKLKSGETVIDRRNSLLQATVPKQLGTALRRITGGLGLIQEETKFSKNIGADNCVETGPDDEIVFAVRAGSRAHRFSRFVKNREAKPSKVLTVVLQRDPEGGYAILAAYVGRKGEPEPGDPRATEQSVPFWADHALVWGSVETVPGTETASLQTETRSSVSPEDFTIILAWVMGQAKALEWSVGEKTYQVSPDGAFFERHFHAHSSPTRSNRSESQTLVALNSATTPIQLYAGEKGGEGAVFFQNVKAVLVAAKAWLGTT